MKKISRRGFLAAAGLSVAALALTALLGIEEPQKLAFMVAFGYPTHKAGIVPMTEQTGVKYYLDENRDYCVPKRSAEEIARSV